MSGNNKLHTKGSSSGTHHSPLSPLRASAVRVVNPQLGSFCNIYMLELHTNVGMSYRNFDREHVWTSCSMHVANMRIGNTPSQRHAYIMRAGETPKNPHLCFASLSVAAVAAAIAAAATLAAGVLMFSVQVSVPQPDDNKAGG